MTTLSAARAYRLSLALSGAYARKQRGFDFIHLKRIRCELSLSKDALLDVETKLDALANKLSERVMILEQMMVRFILRQTGWEPVHADGQLSEHWCCPTLEIDGVLWFVWMENGGRCGHDYRGRLCRSNPSNTLRLPR